MEVSHAGLWNVGGFANELKAFLEFHRTPRCLKPIGRVRRLSSKTQLSLALGRQDLSEQGRFLPIENTCEIPPQASPERGAEERTASASRLERFCNSDCHLALPSSKGTFRAIGIRAPRKHLFSESVCHQNSSALPGAGVGAL